MTGVVSGNQSYYSFYLPVDKLGVPSSLLTVDSSRVSPIDDAPIVWSPIVLIDSIRKPSVVDLSTKSSVAAGDFSGKTPVVVWLAVAVVSSPKPPVVAWAEFTAKSSEKPPVVALSAATVDSSRMPLAVVWSAVIVDSAGKPTVVAGTVDSSAKLSVLVLAVGLHEYDK